MSPRSLHGITARRFLFAVIAAAAVAGVFLAVAGGGGGHHRQTAPSSASTSTTVPSLASQGLSPQTPDTISVAQSPVQVEYDQALAQGLSGPASDGFAALAVPAPGIAGGWPRLAVANDPAAWSTEFVAGLLDINYRDQSRAGLGHWLQAEEAPEILPGVAAAAADKVLYASVLDPAVAGGAPFTAIPSADSWTSDAGAGVRQTVSDMLTEPDPQWSQLISQGWQPPDVRMAGEDVSGVLTVRHGHVTTTARFSLELLVGSGRWHPGYGTVNVGSWTVNP